MDTQPDYKLAADEMAALIDSLGLTASWNFVPFSKSRNSGEKYPSLNWKFTITRDGREIIKDGDYRQGLGHCPAYKNPPKENTRSNYEKNQTIALECETGNVGEYRSFGIRSRGPIPPPSLVDLLCSLLMDASAIDAGGFESWCAECGYDEDSRKAEKIYQACIEIGLKLRSALGNDAFEALRALAARL